MNVRLRNMPRLPRPHIPIPIRLTVALRQVGQQCEPSPQSGRSNSEYLKLLLWILFGEQKCELHHRPALVNRRRYIRNGKIFYDPPANSADHLVYLLETDHDIETRVRGLNGQYSDLAIVRKRKRKERKANRPRRKWPSRRLQSASRWPAKGSRGFSNRATRG